MKKFFTTYFKNLNSTISKLNYKLLEEIVFEINLVKKNKSRIFFIGVGGSAGNASHAVNDFRKICNIECYAPTDNVSELTARINDEGWKSSFSDWLKVSKLNHKDMLIIFSVGGGNSKKKVSMNIVETIKYAKSIGAKVISIVGKKDGFAHKNSDKSLLVSVKNKKYVTPFSESMQSVIWHYLVSHPNLQENRTKW